MKDLSETRDGGIWLADYKGQQWPIMLCPDHIPPPTFMEHRRGCELPAILLGIRKYFWVLKEGLTPFERGKDYLSDGPLFQDLAIRPDDSEGIRLQKNRQLAFLQDAQDRDLTPAFWKNFIETRRETRATERALAANGKHNRGSRRNRGEDVQIISESSFIHSTSKKRKRAEEVQGSKGRQSLTPDLTPTKSSAIKRSMFSYDDGRVPGDEDSDPESIFVGQGQSSSDSFGRARVNAELRALDQEYLAQIKQNPRFDYDDCTIRLKSGDTITRFLVSRKYLGESPVFAKRLDDNEEWGTHLCLEGFDISPPKFAPVAEYLRAGEFAPRLIEQDGVMKLEGIKYAGQADKAAESIAWVYNIARKLQHEDLQTLAARKLRALERLPPACLLKVAKIAVAKCESANEVVLSIAGSTAEHFYELVEKHGALLSQVMGSSATLRTAIHVKLARNPEMGFDDLED